MLADYHIHSHFSDDSQANIYAICDQALAAGLTEIAITDHDDRTWPKKDPSFVLADVDAYFRALTNIRDTYKDKLSLRIGLEIGFNHVRMPDYMALLKNYPFDFILGSAHEVRGVQVHLPSYFIGRSVNQAYTDYYDNLRDFILRYDCYDMIGHLNLLRRYHPQALPADGSEPGSRALENLLRTLVQVGKGLEVNTSTYASLGQPLPGPDILRLYRHLGGTHLTIGSDAHRAKDVGSGIGSAHLLLSKIGFRTYNRYCLRTPLPSPLFSA